MIIQQGQNCLAVLPFFKSEFLYIYERSVETKFTSFLDVESIFLGNYL